MRQRLSAIVLAFALLLFGWGGALAAALCAHAGGGSPAAMPADHTCCSLSAALAEDESAPEETAEEAATGAAHCALALEASAEPAASATHAPRPPASASARAVASASESSDEFASASESSDCAGSERAGPASAPVFGQSFAPASCVHCLGRSERPSAPAVTARAPDRTAKGAHDLAPRAVSAPALNANRFTPPVTPTQGAPPTGARRHLLLSVFLI